MIYRRVMRTPSFSKLTAPLVGVVLVLAGCGGQENAPPAAAGPCAVVENGTPAPKTSEAAWRQSRGGHRLSHGHDRCEHGALRGRHSQPAGHAGGLRGAQGRRYRGRRPRDRSGGARTGRTAVVGDRRRRVPALLRRHGELRYRPTTAARSPPPRRPRTTCAGSPTPIAPSPNPMHGPPAGPSGCREFCGCCPDVHAAARQDRVARSLRSRRDAGRRRLRHQPAARLGDRRRRAAS